MADRASFRDTAGYVEDVDGQLVRHISESFAPEFQAVERSGLFERLHDREMLVPHQRLSAGSTGTIELAPNRVPFISYPFEWTPRQLRDAALLTLDAALEALKHGAMLRDASAFNVQFLNGRPILIDTLSFAPLVNGAPWYAYGQFCRHFLGPLALCALVDPELLRLSEVHADGLPLPLVSRQLGIRGRLRAGVLLHIHLHATAERRSTSWVQAAREVSTQQLRKTFDGLRSTIESLPFASQASGWTQYRGGAHYDADARPEKDTFVARSIERLNARRIWDLGANTGDIAFRHVTGGGYVLAIDSDLACVESIYARARRERVAVMPMWRDLRVPTPSTGWAAEERAALHERDTPELVLALALAHHLIIAGGIPLRRIAEWLASLAPFVVIELVDADDPMVQQMLATRSSLVYPGRAAMRTELMRYFEVLEEQPLTGVPRTLMLLKRGVVVQ